MQALLGLSFMELLIEPPGEGGGGVDGRRSVTLLQIAVVNCSWGNCYCKSHGGPFQMVRAG